MVFGFVAMDLAVLKTWKARALQIVRSSRDQMRSLQLMRDKAASIFDCDVLRAPSKLRRNSVPAPSTPVVPGSVAVGRGERVEVVRPRCLVPDVLKIRGVVAAAATQADHLDVPGVRARPGRLRLSSCCSDRCVGLEGLEPRRGALFYGRRRLPVSHGGVPFLGSVYEVLIAAVLPGEHEVFEDQFQTKNCITKRVKMHHKK